MTSNLKRIPDGPAEKYDPSVDLLEWLSRNFARYGDMYRASIYGADVYVASHPRYADHVLRVNWQNYRKGQSNRRVGFLLGNDHLGDYFPHAGTEVYISPCLI